MRTLVMSFPFLLSGFLISFHAHPAQASSINGKHRCEQGGSMTISGYNGMVSAPIVTFKGKTYHLIPYTHPMATYLTFVDVNGGGVSLGVDRRPFLVIKVNERVVDRCNAVSPY